MCRASWLLITACGMFAAAPDCLLLRQEAVTAADLAPGLPAFAALPGLTPVAWAPVPGVTRWIPPGELARLGRQFGRSEERRVGTECA